jgi:hypothetical protein
LTFAISQRYLIRSWRWVIVVHAWSCVCVYTLQQNKIRNWFLLESPELEFFFPILTQLVKIFLKLAQLKKYLTLTQIHESQMYYMCDLLRHAYSTYVFLVLHIYCMHNHSTHVIHVHLNMLKRLNREGWDCLSCMTTMVLMMRAHQQVNLLNVV